MTEYRIVRDNWLGFEVQSRRWWWPFWSQGVTNTHSSIEEAERYANEIARPPVKYLGKTPVKYLGKIGVAA